MVMSAAAEATGSARRGAALVNFISPSIQMAKEISRAAMSDPTNDSKIALTG